MDEQHVKDRLGKVTASRIAEIMARTKTGYSTSRANYMADLIAERLTGVPTNGYVSKAMLDGIEREPDARAAYEFHRDATVVETGFVPHPTIPMSGASPDGLIGAHGLIEIKCPMTATHIDTLLNAKIDSKYVFQMEWQLACTGRQWCDWVSFCPLLPSSMQLHVTRVPRDDKLIEAMTQECVSFLSELCEKIAALQSRYPTPDEIAA
jgi:hypothetical protein